MAVKSLPIIDPKTTNRRLLAKTVERWEAAVIEGELWAAPQAKQYRDALTALDLNDDEDPRSWL